MELTATLFKGEGKQVGYWVVAFSHLRLKRACQPRWVRTVNTVSIPIPSYGDGRASSETSLAH